MINFNSFVITIISLKWSNQTWFYTWITYHNLQELLLLFVCWIRFLMRKRLLTWSHWTSTVNHSSRLTQTERFQQSMTMAFFFSNQTQSLDICMKQENAQIIGTLRRKGHGQRWKSICNGIIIILGLVLEAISSGNICLPILENPLHTNPFKNPGSWYKSVRSILKKNGLKILAIARSTCSEINQQLLIYSLDVSLLRWKQST